MELLIKDGHLRIYNGNHEPVGFGDVKTTLPPGEHKITSEQIGDVVKILRFGHISDCLQRSMRGYLLNNGNSAILTVIN